MKTWNLLVAIIIIVAGFYFGNGPIPARAQTYCNVSGCGQCAGNDTCTGQCYSIDPKTGNTYTSCCSWPPPGGGQCCAPACAPGETPADTAYVPPADIGTNSNIDPNCANGCGWNGCGCATGGSGNACPAGQCCGKSGCYFIGPASPQLINPGTRVNGKAPDGETQLSEKVCDRNDDGSKSCHSVDYYYTQQVPFQNTTFSWQGDSNQKEANVKSWLGYDYGQKKCHVCTGGGGPLDGQFTLWIGSTANSLQPLPGTVTTTSPAYPDHSMASQTVPKEKLIRGPTGKVFWAVQAINEVGQSAMSDIRSISFICTGTAPAAPTLSEPIDRAVLTTTSTILKWNPPANWGTNTCATGNTYDVYLDTANPPLRKLTSVPESQTTLNFTGVRGTTYYWRVAANNGLAQTTKSSVFSFTMGVAAWFGGAGGDMTAIGPLRSMVGPTKLFIRDPAGVAWAGGTLDLGGQSASTPGWAMSNSPLSSLLVSDYNFAYLKGQILAGINPTTITAVDTTSLTSGVTDAAGIHYVRTSGDIDVASNIDIGDNKVVWLAEGGDINLKANINLNDNKGLLVIVTDGNINIDPGIGNTTLVDPATLTPHLEGIFIADGAVNTGSGNNQLRIDGSVVGLSGVNLQREKISLLYPVEYFVFRPDLVMNMPSSLLRKNLQWQELAP